MGTLHGDILCDVADAAMGMAFVTTLKPDESFTTMSLTINFFRPVWEARLRFDGAVARPVTSEARPDSVSTSPVNSPGS